MSFGRDVIRIYAPVCDELAENLNNGLSRAERFESKAILTRLNRTKPIFSMICTGYEVNESACSLG